MAAEWRNSVAAPRTNIRTAGSPVGSHHLNTLGDTATDTAHHTANTAKARKDRRGGLHEWLRSAARNNHTRYDWQCNVLLYYCCWLLALPDRDCVKSGSGRSGPATPHSVLQISAVLAGQSINQKKQVHVCTGVAQH